MNCSEFENKITAFIDGDLVKSKRTEFISHREKCSACNQILDDVKSLIQSLAKVNSITTSADFLTKLHSKIEKNKFAKLPLFKRITNFTPFGFRPLYATGFVLALMAIVTTSFLLLTPDTLPKVDISKIITENKNHIKQDFQQPVLFAADYDTTDEDSIDINNRSRFDDKIIMVNKK
ncbi:MAG: hypothetical protein ISR90_05365 [Candidatus Marinimicrobia bacterium]|nr:hypothetical protein [Candidatus Neomarinimicrobiota bacterium]MBL7023465.1 hypothetical protein [Candidatus Neomarinimicrobiota bacterium]MBL7109280.1 hypothetical protein [Candidatus Neomarinimicrobiota bacterium]